MIKTFLDKFQTTIKSPNSKNALWLIFDKVFRMSVGLMIGIFSTRFLGPTNFGTWNYVLAINSLFGVFSTLNMEGVVIGDLVERKFSVDEILGSAFAMRIVGGIVTILLSLIWICVFDGADKLLLVFIAITSLSYMFMAFEVIDYYFQSIVKSRITVKSKMIGLVFSSTLKILALVFKLKLFYFIAITTIELFISSFFLIVFFTKSTNFKIVNWKFRKEYVGQKLKQLFPLILSGMVILIYMRIDQIMIKHYINEMSVGIYSAAVKVSEIWYFIPASIVSSFYPNLLKVKNDLLELRVRQIKLYKLLFVFSVLFAIFFTFASKYVILFLYGSKFSGSAQTLSINTWTGIFVSLGIASNSFLTVTNNYNIQLYRTLFGVVANVILNIFLIPKYGINGAAFATLISQGLSAYLSTVFFRKTRYIFFDMTRACTIDLFKNIKRSDIIIN